MEALHPCGENGRGGWKSVCLIPSRNEENIYMERMMTMNNTKRLMRSRAARVRNILTLIVAVPETQQRKTPKFNGNHSTTGARSCR